MRENNEGDSEQVMKSKKVSALILACFCMLSSLTSYAYEEKTEAETEREVLNALGISLPAEAENGFINKGEFAYLVCAATNDSIAHMYCYLSFADVKLDDWRHDAVMDIVNAGIAVGCGDGTFGIDESISGDTAGRILLRMLGYGRVINPESDIVSAYSGVYADILKGVSRKDAITYADAYKAIYNAMQLKYIGYNLSGSSDNYALSEETFMEYAFDVSKHSGRITGNEFSSFGIGSTGVGYGRVEIDGVRYDTCDTDGANAYLGYYADYYLREDEVIKIIPRRANDVKVIKSSEIKDIRANGSNFELRYSPDDSTNKTIRFPKTSDFVYNGEVTEFRSDIIRKLRDEQFGRVEILSYNDDYTVFVYATDTMVVTNVSAINYEIVGKLYEPLYYDNNDNQRSITITRDGVQINAEDIKKDDIVEVEQSLSGQMVKINVVTQRFTGDLTSGINEDKEISVDNVAYTCSNYFINNVMGKLNFVLGKRYTFLFNSLGEIVDIASGEDFEEKGEFLYVLKARYSEEEEYGFIKAVTLDGSMERRDLAEYVRLNDGAKTDAAVIAELLVPKINGIRQCSLVYVEKDSEGKVYKIYTPDGKHVDGTPSNQEYIKSGAAAANRKFKELTKCFLINTNDMNFPEFYIDSNTKILQVPSSDSSDSDFDEEGNYQKCQTSVFSDAKDYIVEAYNFDEYNVAGILLLRKSKSFDSQRDNSNLIIVRSVTKTVDSDGDVVDAIIGYQNGEKVTIPIYDEEALYYTKNGKKTAIDKGDVIKVGYDLSGRGIFSEYFKNIYTDFEPTPNPEGRNDGNAVAIGTVVSADGEFLRVRMGANGSMAERVFRGEGTVTVFDLYGSGAQKGSRGDLTPGRLVMLRVFYSKVVDIIVIN